MEMFSYIVYSSTRCQHKQFSQANVTRSNVSYSHNICLKSDNHKCNSSLIIRVKLIGELHIVIHTVRARYALRAAWTFSC